MTANIIIAAGSTLPNPPAGEATLFINTEDNNILSLKMPDGSIIHYSASAAAECCSCEIAEKFIKDIGCALKEGMITAAEYTALIQAGLNVTSVDTDDGHGNTTCNVTIAPQNITPVSISIADPGPVSLGAGIPVPLVQTVLPTGANQSVVWTSGTPAKGTVNPATGVFTAVELGTTVITAFSAINPSISGTRTITIEA